MGKSDADEKIISYNDVVLRKSDLDILSGPRFLNDRIIEFYFSHLSSCHPSKELLLVPPSISFWIANSPDKQSLNEVLRPLNLPARTLVIFPVNDNLDFTTPEGGSHWSLLVFERNTNTFFHHDSYRGSNRNHARRLHENVGPFMGPGSSGPGVNYVDGPDSPQQENSHDCGLYVTAIAGVICRWYENCDELTDTEGLWFSAVEEEVTPCSVAQMRDRILGLIRDLMVDGNLLNYC